MVSCNGHIGWRPISTRGSRMANMEYVRRLLEQNQPGFAASREFTVSLAETSRRNRWTMN